MRRGGGDATVTDVVGLKEPMMQEARALGVALQFVRESSARGWDRLGIQGVIRGSLLG